MANCKTCKHSVFDPVYGEYKCQKKMRTTWSDLVKEQSCPDYKKGEPEVSKENKSNFNTMH